LLAKDINFDFSEECLRTFNIPKQTLVSALVITTLDFSLPLKLMCDASDIVVGVFLGQRKDRVFHTIYYGSRTLYVPKELHHNKNELLAIVFSFDKFRHYLVLSKIICYIDHSVIKYLMVMQDAIPRLIRWILLL